MSINLRLKFFMINSIVSQTEVQLVLSVMVFVGDLLNFGKSKKSKSK